MGRPVSRAMSSHQETIRRDFAKQAESFADPEYGFADERLTRWILTHVPCEPGSAVLDVAGGTGQIGSRLRPPGRLCLGG
jgi:ubiquinone/menaquinone biosynthesis C-methylase UbiE